MTAVPVARGTLMNVQTKIDTTAVQQTEHFDVLIAGAGISGVGAAYHLATQCPGKRFVVLETQPTFGGTWTTHKYPGIRSDSDLHTFGYRFKPWTSAPIASAQEILAYMGEVITENDLGRHPLSPHHHRCELDPARRSGRGLRLPAAQPYGGDGGQAGHAGAAPGRP